MNNKSHYAVLDGKNVVRVNDPLECFSFLRNIESRRVACDDVEGVIVSTVFTGINCGFGSRELWFETLVFDGALDGHCERYETWQEAEEGHARTVKLVMKYQKPHFRLLAFLTEAVEFAKLCANYVGLWFLYAKCLLIFTMKGNPRHGLRLVQLSRDILRKTRPHCGDDVEAFKKRVFDESVEAFGFDPSELTGDDK